jgi:hypothetical protein
LSGFTFFILIRYPGVNNFHNFNPVFLYL